jgi:hypothetical protein
VKPAKTAIELLESWKRLISNQGHVVCEDCIARLTSKTGNSVPFATRTDADDEVLFQEGNISVSRQRISGPSGGYEIEHVLSVKPTRASFSSAVNVEVFNLARGSITYRLSGKHTASRFIAAIQKAKPNVTVESDNVGWFIIFD